MTTSRPQASAGPPCGLTPSTPGPAAESRRTTAVDVLVVGVGFAGIGLGRHLLEAGIDDFVILDRAAGVGGTWWSNSYPGCQCDIPSHLYSLSFALNPTLTRTYPLQEEIRDYLEGCVERFGLTPHIRLSHEVLQAVWDPGDGRWLVETSRGRFSARVLVAAQGGISEPWLPDIPGKQGFQGAAFHSAAWDHSVDLSGKRVAVVGTGASAVQIIPSIQPEVSSLHVFQRTPPWIMPHMDRPITRLEKAIYRRAPLLQRLPRSFAYLYREIASPGFTRRPWLLRPLEVRARRHMRRQVPDAGLRRRLTPRYRIGCKRILPSNHWYPSLQQPNVELISDAIKEMTPQGVRTAAGQHIGLDVIVFATGFRAADVPFGSRVIGVGGRTLAEVWDGSPRLYKNTTVPGFPNLFMVLGLNTGYSSMVFMIEAQLRYVADALKTMRDRDLHAVEIGKAAYDAWAGAMQRRMRPSVWTAGGCSSWYLDRNGLATTVWPDFTWKFRRATRRFDLDAYVPAYPTALAANAP